MVWGFWAEVALVVGNCSFSVPCVVCKQSNQVPYLLECNNKDYLMEVKWRVVVCQGIWRLALKQHLNCLGTTTFMHLEVPLFPGHHCFWWYVNGFSNLCFPLCNVLFFSGCFQEFFSLCLVFSNVNMMCLSMVLFGFYSDWGALSFLNLSICVSHI